jgi:hypothetical protein
VTSRRPSFALHSLLLAVVCATTVAHAQTESDFKTMDKARALYLTGPIPSSISCTAQLDWDGFFERMKIEQTDVVKARIVKLKNVKISVISRDAEHTDVTVDAGELPANTLTDGLRQQLQGFFQMYWSLSYGQLMAKRGSTFQLTTTPEGYSVKSAEGPMKVSIDMDKAYLITGFGLESQQINATVKPGFKPGDDGLLRLRRIQETVDLGASKMVVDVSFDYQKLGAFDIPQHINMSLPGSFSFDYTLTGCEVKGGTAPTPAAKQ